jgi:hypothetical protein
MLSCLAGCAGSLPDGCPPPAGGDVVYVVSRGWHTEIGVPGDLLLGRLGVFRTIFPGARTVMFGYGKRTFMTAPVEGPAEYLLGPFPGPAVIEAVGLKVTPPEAYGPADMVALALPPGGAARLANFIAQDLAPDREGGPRLVGPGKFPGSLFYAARSGYSLTHTCNGWVADALHAAGLKVSGAGVVFSGQAMARAEHAAHAQCAVAQQ